MINNVFFLIGISVMIIHEMDAIRCKEWRIIPGLSGLVNRKGQAIFLWLHIPIFILLFWKLINYSDITTFRIGLDIFFIVHFVLHILFLNHHRNEFKDLVSWIIISAIFICGILDLLLILINNQIN